MQDIYGVSLTFEGHLQRIGGAVTQEEMGDIMIAIELSKREDEPSFVQNRARFSGIRHLVFDDKLRSELGTFEDGVTALFSSKIVDESGNPIRTDAPTIQELYKQYKQTVARIGELVRKML